MIAWELTLTLIWEEQNNTTTKHTENNVTFFQLTSTNLKPMPSTPYVRRKTDESPMPVSKHLKEKAFRDNRVWTYCGREDVLYTFVNGKRYTAKEFDKKYPVYKPAHFYACPENPDKRRTYLL